MSKPCVVLIGDSGRAEFRHIAEDLARQCYVVQASAPEAAFSLAQVLTEPPDLCLLLQPAPILPAEVQTLSRLFAIFPLMPIVIVLGSWAEGETRTGRPVPGTLRVFWYEWSTFWLHFLEHFQLKHAFVTSLPRTSSPEELILFQSARKPRILPLTTEATESCCTRADNPDTLNPLSGTAAIVTPVFENFRLLRDILELGGWSSTWLRRIANPAAHEEELRRSPLVIVDVMEDLPQLNKTLRAIRAASRQALLLVLQTFPRPQEFELVHTLGPSLLLRKPIDVDELLEQVGRFSHSRAQKQATGCG